MEVPIITNPPAPQIQPDIPHVPQAPSTAENLRQKLRSPWAGIAAIIAILVIGSLIFSVRRPTAPSVLIPTPTTTIYPTPTPQRTPSVIASQSAFISLDASIQTLANDIGTLTIQDPSLSPPVLDLPLGYPSN
ncbi:hypothetical protein HY948_04555 [Candidatus Gottesmanbacteria bacterium]|nr:hypothetical protein [Candidatus Gottesmanbacteria bacterium]